MRRIIALLASLALHGVGAAAEPPSGTERLAAPALPGFVTGYEAANATQSIREEVPKGETVKAWTRMVTTQRFGGLAAQATPETYARNILDALPGSCPAAKAPPVTSLKVSGRPAISFQVDCPRNSGGQPETFMLLAVAGRSDMHVKQVAFRGRTSAADLAWGRKFIAGTVLCAARDRQPACQ